MAKTIFDIYTQKYDNWFVKNQHAYLTELLALKREIPNSKKGIDIGTARFGQMLKISFGIDIFYPMLKIAKSRSGEVAVTDAENLPFRSNEFDHVLLTVILCFIKYLKKVITEIKRILAKNEKLIIGIIDKKNYFRKLYQKRSSIFYKSVRLSPQQKK